MNTILKEIFNTHTKVIQLEYIIMVLHHCDDLKVTGRAVRLEKGVKLLIEGGIIEEPILDEHYTHIVTQCQGTYSGSELSISVIDLKTQELSEINL